MKTNYLPALATLKLSNGQSSNWRFAPKTVMIDDVTDYIVAMHLDFDNGERCNLVLAPKDIDAYRRAEFIGDILAELGAQVVGGYIKSGNAIVDNVVSFGAGQFASTAVRNMFKHLLHSQCGYFAMDNNELVVPKAMTAFDLRDV